MGLIGLPDTPQLPAIPAPVTVTPASVANVAPPATVTPRAITADETVAGHMNSLLAGNSTYMQSARASGMAQANSRGLINSSLAAGTSEKAAIDSAMPIATQDANTYANAGQSAQNANQELKQAGYTGLINSAQQKENFGYTTAANAQNIAGNVALQDTSLAAAEKRQTQAEGATSTLQTANNAAALTRQTQGESATTKLNELNNAAALARQTQGEGSQAAITAANNASTLARQQDQQKAEAAAAHLLANIVDPATGQPVNMELSKLNAQERTSQTNATTPVLQVYQQELSRIQSTPDEVLSPDAKTAALNFQRDVVLKQLKAISAVYTHPIDWNIALATTPTSLTGGKGLVQSAQGATNDQITQQGIDNQASSYPVVAGGPA